MKNDAKIILIVVLITLALIYVVPSMGNQNKKVIAKRVANDWYDLAAKYASYYAFDVTNVLAVICQESAGNPDSVNPSDPSRGLMQITPGALSDFNRIIGRSYTFDEMFTPYKNIEVGVWYLATRYKTTKDLTKAFAAYNAGLGNIPAGASYAEKVKSFIPYILEEIKGR